MAKPDPSLLIDVVAARVLEAMSTASDMLKRAGVRHVVVGGLAVGANGFPRATKDVDFLAEALEAEPGSMIDAPPLIYLKLKSPRLKDRVDVVELVKGGVDLDRCRAYLAAHAPRFVADFDDAVRRAQAEDE